MLLRYLISEQVLLFLPFIVANNLEVAIKLFQRISRKTGFTVSETKIILFLLTAFVAGAVVNIWKDKSGNDSFLEFDYAKQDSLFYNSKSYSRAEKSEQKLIEKEVDSKRELLDFRNAKIEEKKDKAGFGALKIVNINNASVEVLSSLPGVGNKIARNIVDYRERRGRIKHVDELLNVKGIGKIKLDKIKSLVTVN